MDTFGFIHEKLDIKLLILYVLRRLPSVVDDVTLSELCMFDGGVVYFDYTDCLSELVTAGLVEEQEDGYCITEKGMQSIDPVESSLPYSVRAKADKLIQPVADKMRREAMIVAEHNVDENGNCKMRLAVSDGIGEILRMEILWTDEEQAKTVEKNFRKNAETYYQKIVELLGKKP